MAGSCFLASLGYSGRASTFKEIITRHEHKTATLGGV